MTSFLQDALLLSFPIRGGTSPLNLEHQRSEFYVENLIRFLDAKDKAREKHKHTCEIERHFATNMVHKNAHKFKGKNKVSRTTPSGFVYKARTQFKESIYHQFLPTKFKIYIIKFILLDSYSK
jgi:hypothetical protein